MRYEALPGAEVTVVVERPVGGRHGVGVTVSPRSPSSSARVTTRCGRSRCSGRRNRSSPTTTGRSAPPTAAPAKAPAGDGGGEPGDGNGGGDKPGDGNGGGEQVDPASLRLDQQQGAELTPKDGKVTLSGRASSGWITVRDRRTRARTTTEVHEPLVRRRPHRPRLADRVIALSTTEHGAPSTPTLRDVPPSGNPSADDEPATARAAGAARRRQRRDLARRPHGRPVGTVRLDSHGFVTYTGTAPGESVRSSSTGSGPRVRRA